MTQENYQPKQKNNIMSYMPKATSFLTYTGIFLVFASGSILFSAQQINKLENTLRTCKIRGLLEENSKLRERLQKEYLGLEREVRRPDKIII